ncbi:CHAT domain-containing protein [Kitasatospora misakiensis]|uniref:CHAT domain-containing protein n=1 Tax=Kitasatospora misakiensis TaxID=67330 RepID=A0ABW0X4R7_9ACTN
MSELHERVVARVTAAGNARSAEPLRAAEAVEEAFALLRAATPEPEGPVDLDAVHAVFWTFWLRHTGPEDPEAAMNTSVIGMTFGFLYPRAPEHVVFPDPLVAAFDPADPLLDARFAFLAADAHGAPVQAPETGEAERLAALERALGWSGLARRLLPPEHAGDVDVHAQALGLEMIRFGLTGDPDALAAAARHGAAVAEAVAALPPDALDEAGAETAAFALGTVLDATRLLGEPPLDEAARLIAAAPAGLLPPEASTALAQVRELRERATAWPGQFDLMMGTTIAEAGAAEHDAGRIACAVRRLRAAVDATPAGHPAYGFAAGALAEALESLARESGDEDAAREAAAVREAAGLGAADGGSEAGEPTEQALGATVEALRRANDRSGAPPRIELEVLAVTTSLGETVDGPAADERIERFRAALAAAPADDPLRWTHHALLAALVGTRADELRAAREPERAAALDAEAEALTEAATAAAPPGLPVTGLLTARRYDAALPLAALAAAAGEPDGSIADPEVARLAALFSRMTEVRLDNPDSLDHDIEVIREMMGELTEDETAERGNLSAALGSALAARAAASRDLSTSDEIVELLRYARTNAPDRHPGTDQALARTLTLISTLRLDPVAAREAAAVLAEAAAREAAADEAGGSEGTEDYPSALFLAAMAAHTELHGALQNYVLGHDQAELDRARRVALRLKELAAGAGEDRQVRELGLDVMGEEYLNLLDSMGPGGGPNPHTTEELVERCRATFAACPPGHPRRLSAAATLVRTIAQRVLVIHRDDRVQALRLVREAAHLVDEVTPEAPEDMVELMRFEVAMVAATVLGLPIPRGPGAPSTADASPGSNAEEVPGPPIGATARRVLDELLGAGAGGARAALGGFTAPPWIRAHQEIGNAAGALRGAEPRIDDALTHLDAAVELLPQITDRGSDQRSAEHGLSSFDGDLRSVVELILLALAGLATLRQLTEAGFGPGSADRADSDRVAAALADGLLAQLEAARTTLAGPEVDRAVELLERGRGLLLSRRIEARVDLTGLRAAHPEQADEFERLTALLAAETGAAPGTLPERARLDALQASRALDEVIGRVRGLPGFEDFLRPLTAERLRALGAEGPVVLLQQGRRHCHAVVVTEGSVTALLLGAETEELTTRADRLRQAVDAINGRGGARPGPVALVRAAAIVRECLSWTWHEIVRPVLDHLGIAGPVPEDGTAWPRIWWVPTGAFNSLPLHAAQCTGPQDCGTDGCGAALDAVVSSYVPGFQTLAYARGRAARWHADAGPATVGAYDRALLVAVPEEELPGVAAAARHAAELLGAPAPLIGAAATRAAVLGALGEARWAHFGCHAATDPAEPSGARLHLPSGERLSVLEICRARPDAARLAFLTACGTARSSERLSDEAIHITSAFLLAGFPGAVGTLWEIDGEYAERVTRDFYRHVTAEDGGGPAASALALHRTVRELRHRLPDRPHLWAAYVHAGA